MKAKQIYILVGLILIIVIAVGSWLVLRPKTCNDHLDCPKKMKCENNICIDVGCLEADRVADFPAVPARDLLNDHEATECCEGLMRIGLATRDAFDEDCTFNPRKMGVGNSGHACTDCGNGVCGKWENKCTCPEDCE